MSSTSDGSSSQAADIMWAIMPMDTREMMQRLYVSHEDTRLNAEEVKLLTKVKDTLDRAASLLEELLVDQVARSESCPDPERAHIMRDTANENLPLVAQLHGYAQRLGEVLDQLPTADRPLRLLKDALTVH